MQKGQAMYKIIGADGKEYGPISIEQLRQWIADGRVNAESRVQEADAVEWKTAADFPELGLAPVGGFTSGGSPPPLPSGRPSAQQNGLAITSFVLGLLSPVCFGLLAGIPAIICGHLARARARRSPAQYGGAGFALAGLILGYAGLVISLLILPAMLLPALSRAKGKAQSINCRNNMMQIGLSFRTWAVDNHGNFPFNLSTNKGGTLELCMPGTDRFDLNSAAHFQVLSNELSTPRILVCPADTKKQPALNFLSLKPANVSYKVRSGANVTDTNPNQILAVCPIHNNVLRCDGSVMTERRAQLSKEVLEDANLPLSKEVFQEAKLPPEKEVLQDAKLPLDQVEKSQCQLDLRELFAAVKAYQKVHGDTPDWLSDLVPTYLADTNILVCPAARRTSVRTYPGLEDPRIPTSYTYDFCARKVPNTVWGGAPVTMKDWKNRQRRIYGDALPMIRCTHHDRVLNVSYGGELFESSVSWESDDRFLELAKGLEERPRQQ